jgi:REP-associated tyrosine transposase
MGSEPNFRSECGQAEPLDFVRDGPCRASDAISCRISPCTSSSAATIARRSSSATRIHAQCRDWLAAAAVEYGCAIHACVLMTNHVHLLVTPSAADSLPRTMQSFGRRYVRHVNTIYRRTGTLWEGGYRAGPIDGEACFPACCRYIELNPVRAEWSGIPARIAGRAFTPTRWEGLICCSPVMRSLTGSAGTLPSDRRSTGRCFEPRSIPVSSMACARRPMAVGRWGIRVSIAKALGRRVTPLARGRPPKAKAERRQLSLL